MGNTITYRKLLEVSLNHPGYGEAGIPDISVEPSEGTLTRMRGRREMFRPTPEGFLVASRMAVGEQESQAFARDPGMVFYLRMTNDRFLKLSDMDFQPGKVFYFSNAASGEEDPPYRRLDLRPSRFAFSFPYQLRQSGTNPATEGLVPLKEMEIRRLSGGQTEVVRYPSGQVPATLNLDFAGYPEGAYRLSFSFQGKSSLEYEFFLSRLRMAGIPLGVFEWLRPTGGPGTTPETVNLDFAPRSTHWRYHIHAGDPLDHQDVRIESNEVQGRRIRFVPSTSLPGVNGVTFVSDEAIAVAVRYEWRFTLTMLRSNLKLSLPHPVHHQIGNGTMITGEGALSVSELVVRL